MTDVARCDAEWHSAANHNDLFNVHADFEIEFSLNNILKERFDSAILMKNNEKTEFTYLPFGSRTS